MRRWLSSRQAYTPRMWPPLLIAVVLTSAMSWLLQPPLFAAIVVPVLIGAGVAQVRWMVWRRRHPPLPTWVRARREAPWN